MSSMEEEMQELRQEIQAKESLIQEQKETEKQLEQVSQSRQKSLLHKTFRHL